MERAILRLSFYFAGYAKKQFISRKIGQNIMAACINIQIRIMLDNVFCWILILYFLLPYRFSFAAFRIYLLPFARSSVALDIFLSCPLLSNYVCHS